MVCLIIADMESTLTPSYMILYGPWPRPRLVLFAETSKKYYCLFCIDMYIYTLFKIVALLLKFITLASLYFTTLIHLIFPQLQISRIFCSRIQFSRTFIFRAPLPVLVGNCHLSSHQRFPWSAENQLYQRLERIDCLFLP